MGLSDERKLGQYLSEIVGFLYTILYVYIILNIICYTKSSVLYLENSLMQLSTENNESGE